MPELTLKDTSRHIDTPEGKLHYHEAGEGPPLLLLHGSGPGVSSWANYRGNMGVFAEHFCVLALDFPGFGRSYSPEANPVLAAPGAVTSFLDALGLESIAIVGNSMGGGVAAQVAARGAEKLEHLDDLLRAADFVSVQPRPVPQPKAEPVCRIRHPSGLLIECLSWPNARWIGELCGAACVPT